MIAIRPATVADAARLSEFACRTFHETFAARNRPEDMAAYLSGAFSVAKQLAEIEDLDTITLLVEDNAVLVGYAQLRRGEAPACVPDSNTIELVRFYVDRARHGRGIAQTLMQAVMTAAIRKAESIWLGVWEHNQRAIRFYEKCGFVDVGSHVFYLGADPQTDRIMRRQLVARIS
jgi:ribosomal protein S18 acetylase RimI-like enzyme